MKKFFIASLLASAALTVQAEPFAFEVQFGDPEQDHRIGELNIAVTPSVNLSEPVANIFYTNENEDLYDGQVRHDGVVQDPIAGQDFKTSLELFSEGNPDIS